jgi:hypothetical protein
MTERYDEINSRSTQFWERAYKYSAFRKSLCTYKRFWKKIEGTMVNKNGIKQLHTLPVLHFNRCLTTEYSDTTVHINVNFDTDK